MYILQKKDKPRTAVQSIGPQTKFNIRDIKTKERKSKEEKEQRALGLHQKYDI